MVDANGESRTVRARFVAGTDGATSFVRDPLGIKNKGRGCFFDWLILDMIPHFDYVAVRGDWPAQWQLCDRARPTIIIVGTERIQTRGMWRTVEVMAGPVTLRPHQGQIASARRGHEDWWKALDWVRDGLIAGSMPWEVEVTAALPKVRPGGRATSTKGAESGQSLFKGQTRASSCPFIAALAAFRHHLICGGVGR